MLRRRKKYAKLNRAIRIGIASISAVFLAATLTHSQITQLPLNSLAVTQLDSLTALGSSKVVGVITGSKNIAFQFTLASITDSVRVRVDASMDTTKGWVNNITNESNGGLLCQSNGTYGFYSDIADGFKYFRLFYATRGGSSAKLRLISARVSGGY